MTRTAEVVSTVADLAAARAAQPGSVGVAMTMGALHAGHVDLIRAARAACDRSIAIREAMIRAAPATPWARPGLGASLLQRGQLRRSDGDAAGAAADIRRALTVLAEYPAEIGDAAVTEASCHAALSDLASVLGSGVSAAEGTAEADAAVAVLRRAFDRGHRDGSSLRDPVFDRMRERADFRLLMLDFAFPADAFATDRRTAANHPAG